VGKKECRPGEREGTGKAGKGWRQVLVCPRSLEETTRVSSPQGTEAQGYT
jgi:hypothetical protein